MIPSVRFTVLCFMSFLTVFGVSDDEAIPTGASRVKCFPIMIEPKSATLEGLIWIENLSTARVALFGNKGHVTTYCEFVRLEARLDDGTWDTVVDFDTKRFSQEVLTTKVDKSTISKFDSFVRESGYPQQEVGIVRLRINLGKTHFK